MADSGPSTEKLTGAKVAPEAPSRPPTEFLEVRDLRIHFPTDDGLVKAVDGVSYSLTEGRTLGIVGESGSGKSVSSLGIMGLYNSKNATMSGEIWVAGQEIVGSSALQVRRMRGRTMAMIFQDPLSSLNPYHTIGAQIIEAYQLHNDVSKQVARKHAIEMLGRVGIPQPDRRVDDYPHHFSGGMRQRAMIAMSLSCDPQLLIADEPTTALDVTVQAQILDLIRDLQEEFNSAVIMITHDLGVVAEVADDVLVMYAGKPVEYGDVNTVFHRPEHPYTWGLMGSMPRLDRPPTERLLPIKGTPPSLINLPSGCSFHPRCAYRELNEGKSESWVPELRESIPGHKVACHLPRERRQEIWTKEIQPKVTEEPLSPATPDTPTDLEDK